MVSFMIKEITVILYEISYSYLRSTCCNYSNYVGNFSTFDHLCRKLAAPFHTVVQKDFKKNDKSVKCVNCVCVGTTMFPGTQVLPIHLEEH